MHGTGSAVQQTTTRFWVRQVFRPQAVRPGTVPSSGARTALGREGARPPGSLVLVSLGGPRDNAEVPPPHAADVAPAGRARPPGPLRVLVVQLLCFATVGTLFTAAYAGLYVLLHGPLGAFWANVVALVLSTVTDTAANRRFTFRVRGPRAMVRHQAQGLILLVVGLVVTSAALWFLHLADPSASRLTEVLALGLANLLVGLGRFTAFRLWVFAPEPEAGARISRSSPEQDGRQVDQQPCSLRS